MICLIPLTFRDWLMTKIIESQEIGKNIFISRKLHINL